MSEPWKPVEFDEATWRRVLAVIQQHPAAFKWIIEEVCGTYDLSFRPDSERATAFAEGKRYVGTQLVKMANLPASYFNPARKDERQGRGKRR